MRAIDLREIIDLAIKKGIKDYIDDGINMGLFPPILARISSSDEQQFDDQVKELKS
jgi:hypothetical protein